MTRSALALALLSCPLLACGTGNPAAPSMKDASTSDVQTTPPDDAGEDASGNETGADAGDPGDGGDAGSEPVSVSFSYTPQWDGVTKVEVVGGFGLSSDWSKTEALVTLTQSGSTYSGTASLPVGVYPYLFRVTGDGQAVPTTTERYALDPLDTAFTPCPAAAPTYSKAVANPCSQITVTASGGSAPAAAIKVKGTVTVDGAAASKWLVFLQRDEKSSHDFFVNRVTLGTDGTFALVASAGTYRLEVEYPTLLSANDLQRNPLELAAYRTATSGTFLLASADVTVVTPDLAFHSYDAFAPVGDGGTLPTAFSFEKGTDAKLYLCGGPGDGGAVTIGDAWYVSATADDGGTVFNGDFNTGAQGTQDAAAPGTRYLWGTLEPFKADAGVEWTKQSMVFPVTWQ